jgi:hypothetical protein
MPAAAALVVAAIVVPLASGCGSDPDGEPGSSSVFPITVTRSGGVAGFHDKVVIASDGAVDVTTAFGRRQCTLDPTVLAALGRAATAITGTASTQPAHPDDMVVIVSTGRGSARAEDPALVAVSGEVSRLLDHEQASSVCR